MLAWKALRLTSKPASEEADTLCRQLTLWASCESGCWQLAQADVWEKDFSHINIRLQKEK